MSHPSKRYRSGNKQVIGAISPGDKFVRVWIAIFLVLAILSGHAYSIPWVDVLSVAVMYLGFTVIMAFDPVYALVQLAARMVVHGPNIIARHKHAVAPWRWTPGDVP